MKLKCYLFILFIQACSPTVSDSRLIEKDSTIKCINNNEDNGKDSLLNNKTPIWKVEISCNGEEVLLRGDSINFIKDDYQQLIAALNKNNKVQIEFQKIRGNCIYVAIINSTYFTQNIGDTGADWYLASLVFTLTENDAYKYVFVDFKEGDHGGLPRRMSRDSFTHYKYDQ